MSALHNQHTRRNTAVVCSLSGVLEHSHHRTCTLTLVRSPERILRSALKPDSDETTRLGDTIKHRTYRQTLTPRINWSLVHASTKAILCPSSPLHQGLLQKRDKFFCIIFPLSKQSCLSHAAVSLSLGHERLHCSDPRTSHMTKQHVSPPKRMSLEPVGRTFKRSYIPR